jgi:F-type H+-transporting ATPase subunit b
MLLNILNSIQVNAAEKAVETTNKATEKLPLGIDFVQILFYMLCFVIAMVVLQKYLFLPLVKILDEREAKVAETLDKADELELKIANADNQAKSIIAEAHANARQIIEDAKIDIEPTKAKYLSDAENQRTEIIANANREADKIVSTATATAEKQVLSLVQKTIQKATNNLSISGSAQNEILGSIVNLKI